MNRLILWIPLGVILALILAMGVVLFQPNDGGEDPMIGRPLPDREGGQQERGRHEHEQHIDRVPAAQFQL